MIYAHYDVFGRILCISETDEPIEAGDMPGAVGMATLPAGSDVSPDTHWLEPDATHTTFTLKERPTLDAQITVNQNTITVPAHTHIEGDYDAHVDTGDKEATVTFDLMEGQVMHIVIAQWPYRTYEADLIKPVVVHGHGPRTATPAGIHYSIQEH